MEKEKRNDSMRKKRETVIVNKQKYNILRSFGHRKDGYLYLVSQGDDMFLLKEFTNNSIEKIVKDYNFLKKLGIPMPKLIDVDISKGILVKEFLDGESAYSYLQRGELEETYLDQLRNIAILVENHKVCLDYFPTHYFCANKILYYTHYSCEECTEDTKFEKCANKYWIGKQDLWKTLAIR